MVSSIFLPDLSFVLLGTSSASFPGSKGFNFAMTACAFSGLDYTRFVHSIGSFSRSYNSSNPLA